MTQYQLLPFERTATMLDELAGIVISPGTLYNAIETAAERLETPVATIREAVVAAPIAHADETGMRVGGGLQWLHVLSNASLTAYFAHPKRGGEALEAFGLLARFSGVLVHDHWKAYIRFDCLHAFCNAHHLRELIAIAETIPSQKPWAEDMIALLCEANMLTIEARAAGFAALPGPLVVDIQSPLRRHPRRRQGAQSRPRAQARQPPARAPESRPQPRQTPQREARSSAALRHRPACPLRQQPGRARRAHAQAQAEGLRMLPLRSRGRPLRRSSAPTSPLCESSPPTSSSPWS